MTTLTPSIHRILILAIIAECNSKRKESTGYIHINDLFPNNLIIALNSKQRIGKN